MKSMEVRSFQDRVKETQIFQKPLAIGFDQTQGQMQMKITELQKSGMLKNASTERNKRKYCWILHETFDDTRVLRTKES